MFIITFVLLASDAPEKRVARNVARGCDIKFLNLSSDNNSGNLIVIIM